MAGRGDRGRTGLEEAPVIPARALSASLEPIRVDPPEESRWLSPTTFSVTAAFMGSGLRDADPE